MQEEEPKPKPKPIPIPEPVYKPDRERQDRGGLIKESEKGDTQR
jgi:hypothetical protein